MRSDFSWKKQWTKFSFQFPQRYRSYRTEVRKKASTKWIKNGRTPVSPLAWLRCAKNADFARGHGEAQRPRSHTMVTICCYLNQQGTKSRRNPFQVQPTGNAGNLSAPRRCFGARTTVSFYCLECCQYFRIWITTYRENTVWYAAHPPNKVTKSDSKRFLSLRRVTRRQVMTRHFTANDTYQ